MFHSSRTTLKELKKRYLNILKKCLLANLMAFSFCLPAMAETITDENGNVFISYEGTQEEFVEATVTHGITLPGNVTVNLSNAIYLGGGVGINEYSAQNVQFNMVNTIVNGRLGGGITGGQYQAQISDTNITSLNSYIINLKNSELNNSSSIFGTSGTIAKIKDRVEFNFEDTVINTEGLTGVYASDNARFDVKEFQINFKNVTSTGYLLGTASNYVMSTWLWFSRHIFNIDKFSINLDNYIGNGTVRIINSTPDRMSSEEHDIYTFKEMNINLKNSNVPEVKAIHSAASKVTVENNLNIFIDKDSVVAGNVLAYQGLLGKSNNYGRSVADIKNITIGVQGNVGGIYGLILDNTKAITTGDIIVNLDGATIQNNVTGAYLDIKNQYVSTGDFKVNVYGNTVVNGSIMASNDKENEVLTMGESILTVEENAHLTVGSVDMDTNIIKGDISFIDQIKLKKKGALKGSVNSQNLGETSVFLEEDSSLQLTGTSNIETLSSDGGTVDLSNTTSETSIQVGSLEGEGTTFKVASEEVAQTTIGNNKSKKLTVSATGEFNDQVNDANKLASSLASVLTIQEGETDLALTAEEGKIARPMTAEVKDGLVQNVHVSGNGVTESVKDVMGLQVLSFRNQINDVQKRMGDLRLDENTKGTWVRAFGGDVKFGDMGLKNKYNTLQAGADFKKGNAYFGVMASLTKGDSKMNRGTGEDKTYGMGVYAGYMANNGWYLDATAKQMHLQNKFKAQYTTGEVSRGSYKTWGTSVSLEAGKRMQLPCGFFVEPQAELMYGRVQGIDYTTSAGVKVEQEAFESLIGRAGLSAGKTFKDKGSIYANVSILNDFAGKTKTSFTYQSQETKTREDMGGAWTEFAVGGTYKLNKNTAVYGEFATSKGTDLTNPIQWSVGLRLSF